MNIEIMEFPSRSLLDEFVRAPTRQAISLGDNGESPRAYYAVIAGVLENNEIVIAFTSSMPGVIPQIVCNGNWSFAIGVDDIVHVVDVKIHVASKLKLPGAFFEFVRLKSEDVVVVNELGVTKIDFRGNEVWSNVMDDVVNDYSDELRGLLIEKGSGGNILIDYEDGRVEAA